jgi:hypothetical protein
VSLDSLPDEFQWKNFLLSLFLLFFAFIDEASRFLFLSIPPATSHPHQVPLAIYFKMCVNNGELKNGRSERRKKTEHMMMRLLNDDVRKKTIILS